MSPTVSVWIWSTGSTDFQLLTYLQLGYRFEGQIHWVTERQGGWKSKETAGDVCNRWCTMWLQKRFIVKVKVIGAYGVLQNAGTLYAVEKLKFERRENVKSKGWVQMMHYRCTLMCWHVKVNVKSWGQKGEDVNLWDTADMRFIMLNTSAVETQASVSCCAF